MDPGPDPGCAASSNSRHIVNNTYAVSNVVQVFTLVISANEAISSAWIIDIAINIIDTLTAVVLHPGPQHRSQDLS
jgi:hypothetical protein